MRYFSGWLLLLFVGACAPKKVDAPADTARPGNKLLIKNDFENLEGWVSPSSSLNKEQAHSGQYSIKTDRQNEYSLGYDTVLGTLLPDRARKLRLRAWAYKTRAGDDYLIVQVLRSAADRTNVFYHATDLGKDVKKAGEWGFVSDEFELPAEVQATNQLRIYLWGPHASAPVYLDDLEISAE